MKFNATIRSAAIAGVISGIYAIVAGYLGEYLVTDGEKALLNWSFLLLGFAVPVLVLVFGIDYVRGVLRVTPLHDVGEAFKGILLRLTIWFGIAAAILIIGGLVLTLGISPR